MDLAERGDALIGRVAFAAMAARQAWRDTASVDRLSEDPSPLGVTFEPIDAADEPEMLEAQRNRVRAARKAVRR